MASAWIGTSGFRYPEWKPDFYPQDLPEKEFLPYYASRFPAVEIDSTFYRMPNATTLEGWRTRTPEGFRFAIKASRRITHFARLKLPSEAVDYLAGSLPLLEGRLGVCLFQLPPNFRADLPRLAAFLAAWPASLPRAFEFRHASWFQAETYDLLRSHGAGLCIHDADEGATPDEVTGDLVYLRLRRSEYPPEALQAWADRIAAWVAGGADVYAFLKHEDNPDATRQALALRDLVLGPR